MKTNISIPADLYENLYNEIMDYGFEPENEEDCHCDMDVEIGKFGVSVRATFDIKYIDDSFDHAFGTEYGYHFEAGDLISIEGVEVWYYDDDNNGFDISEQFDEKFFWQQSK